MSQWTAMRFNPRPPLLAGDALPTQNIEKTYFFYRFPRTGGNELGLQHSSCRKNMEIYSNQRVKKCANLLVKKPSLGVRG
jgi:hypothetical protein